MKILLAILLLASTAGAVPVLRSRPAAPIALYLDFDGDFVERPYPAPPANLSDAQIFAAWQYTATTYAPFNLDVTTVDPGNIDTIAGDYAVNIGGSGIAQYPGFDGLTFTQGEAWTPKFPPAIKARSYVFSDRLDPSIVGNAIVHEAGHGFGAVHNDDPTSFMYPYTGVGFRWTQVDIDAMRLPPAPVPEPSCVLIAPMLLLMRNRKA